MIGRPLRDGFHTVTPYLIVHGVDRMIMFVKQAFDATETFRSTGAAGGTHVEVRIGDSMVMIGGDGPQPAQPMPAMLHLYVEDADGVYRRALDAGATSLMEPADMGDGDRRGGVQDAWGNQWYISTHLGVNIEGATQHGT